MAATLRRFPIGVGRFTYWAHTGIRPEESASLLSAQLDNDARHELVRSTALLRIAHGTGSRGQFLEELVWWKSNDPLFSSDRDAAGLLKKLASDERAVFTRRTRAPRFVRSGKQDLPGLVGVIARDQVIYEASLHVPRPGRLEKLTAAFARGDARSIAEILRYYRRQHRRLLGEPLNRADATFLEAQGIQLAEGRRVRRTCADNDEVIHWLAHALRNVLRWRDGHPPLPWAPSCRSKCLQVRDELAGVQVIRQRDALVTKGGRSN